MQPVNWIAALGIGLVVGGFVTAMSGGDDTALAAPSGAVAATGDGLAVGRVRSVTLSRLIVERDGRDWTFAVNEDTDVRAGGAARVTRAWGSTPITTFVQTGDTVSVTYLDTGGEMVASHVRLALVNP